MSFVLNAPAIVLGSASAVALAVAAVSWSRRRGVGGTSFFIMTCSVFAWRWDRPLVLFALRYRRHEWEPSLWLVVVLWVIPVVTLALAATNGLHGLLWSSITPSPRPGSTMVIYGHGPWYWVSSRYGISRIGGTRSWSAKGSLRTSAPRWRRTRR